MPCEVCGDRGYLRKPQEKRFCLECERGRFLAASEPQPRSDAMGGIIRNLTLGYEMQSTPENEEAE